MPGSLSSLIMFLQPQGKTEIAKRPELFRFPCADGFLQGSGVALAGLPLACSA